MKILFILLCMATLTTACQSIPSCEVYKRRFYKLETDLIVLDKGPDGRECLLKGINPITHKPVTFYDEEGFYIYIKSLIDIGDTLVKVKGNAVFLIKKSGSNVKADYPCENENSRSINYSPVIIKK